MGVSPVKRMKHRNVLIGEIVFAFLWERMKVFLGVNLMVVHIVKKADELNVRSLEIVYA